MFFVLLACLSVSFITTYACAVHLFPGSHLEALATTVLFWVGLLTLAPLIAGTLGVLQWQAVVIILSILIVILWWVRPRLPVLSPSTRLPHSEPIRLNIYEFLFGLAICGIIQILVIRIAYTSWTTPIPDFDIMCCHFPTLLQFLQHRTLWILEGRFTYYPYGYELYLSWSFLFLRSHSITFGLHILLFGGVLAYSVLLGRHALEGLKPRMAYLAQGLMLILVMLAWVIEHVTARIGKNDLLIGMCTLAAIFYWLRYWTSAEKNPFYLSLMGMAIGIMTGSKFIAILGGVLLGLGHLMMLIRTQNFRRQTLLSHLLWVGVPILIWSAIWYIRVLQYNYTLQDQEFYDWATSNRFIYHMDAPVALNAMVKWGSVAIVIMIGGILMLIPPGDNLLGRFRQAGAGIFFVMLVVKFYSSIDWMGLAVLVPIYTAWGVCTIILMGYWLIPHIVTRSLAVLTLFTLATFMVFPFTPLSAMMPYFIGDNPAFLVVEYRYNVAGFMLLMVVLAILIIRLLDNLSQYPLTLQPFQVSPRVIGGTLLASLILIFIVRLATFKPLTDMPGYLNPDNNYEEPTRIYAWAYQNLHNTSIYVAGLPPYIFYGENLENELYIYPHDSISWQWSDVEALIQQQAIEYAILGAHQRFPIPAGMQQGIAEMRTRYEVVYEDEQGIIFKIREPS